MHVLWHWETSRFWRNTDSHKHVQDKSRQILARIGGQCILLMNEEPLKLMDPGEQKVHLPYECDPGKFTYYIRDDPIPTHILTALNGFRRLKEEHRKFWGKVMKKWEELEKTWWFNVHLISTYISLNFQKLFINSCKLMNSICSTEFYFFKFFNILYRINIHHST